jgi:hypothetical protein
VLSSADLLFDVNPARIGLGSIRSVARLIAERELQEQAISELVNSNEKLTSLCRGVFGAEDLDATWSSIVLLVVLAADSRSRRLLANSQLTQLDLETAVVLETYGRGEITRRSRLCAAQADEEADKTDAVEAEVPLRPMLAPYGAVMEDHTSDLVADDDYDGRATIKRRKRTPSTLPTTEAAGTLDWWHAALSSKFRSVVSTLVTNTRENATEAALSTLLAQAEGSNVSHSSVIAEVSASNATRCAEALAPFVNRTQTSLPTWVATTVRDAPPDRVEDPHMGPSAKMPAVALCLGRVPRPGIGYALHASMRIERASRPSERSGIGILHSVATQKLCVRGADAWTPPGVLERHAMCGEIRSHASEQSIGGRSARILASLDDYIKQSALPVMPSTETGTTRSFVAFETMIVTHSQTIASATALAKEGRMLYSEASRRDAASAETDVLTAHKLGQACTPSARSEPYATPASRLSIGFRINETVRRLMANRVRKNEPTRVPLGYMDAHDLARDGTVLIADSEPIPMCHLTDFDVRVAPNTHPRNLPSDGTANHVHVPASVAVHVCLDRAVRAVDAIRNATTLANKRSLLFVGTIHASFIASLAMATGASAANAAVNASKRILVGDTNLLPFLTIYDVYAGGLTNVARSYASTAYSGTHASLVDTGITSVGLQAHYVRSDRRGHGSMVLPLDAADAIAARLARAHFVTVGDNKYVAAPPSTRGIPHGYIPGIHSCLNDYTIALDELFGAGSDTVNGLFSMPFSPFTQALAPTVEATIDPTIRLTFRNVFEASSLTGRSNLPDATSDADAIAIEPLFRRPSIESSTDNPFCNIYPYVETALAACAAIAQLASILKPNASSAGKVSALHSCITAFHAEGQRTTFSTLVAIDACVLLHALFPASHSIGEPVVTACYAIAHPQIHRSHRDGNEHALLEDVLTEEEVESARSFWARFSTRSTERCPWHVGIAPMLTILLDRDGSHLVTSETVFQMRAVLNTLCSSTAWLVYSEDGVLPPAKPNPLADISEARKVKRPQLDPIAVANDDLSIKPRGALVGLLPFQFRQLLTLMNASHLPGCDEVTVVRNEGQLALRASSLPTILEQSGRKRSAKAISPLQTESETHFGNRLSRVYGAQLQQKAWAMNAQLITPLMTSLNPPRSVEERMRGEMGAAQMTKASIQEAPNRSHDLERRATRTLQMGCVSDLTALARRVV